MKQASRWSVASLLSLGATGVTWAVSQWLLGLDVPTAVTLATSAAAVVGAPAAAWAAQKSASPSLAISAAQQGTPMVWNMPARSRVFTGRRDTLLALRDEAGGAGPVAILALHGIGGVGKTSLAVEFAHRFADDYAIAWWINAEHPEFIEEQLAALGAAAGWVTATTDAPGAAREVLRRLRRTTGWLVILDNVERPEDVLRLLPQGTGHVLVTSRNKDWRQVASVIEVDIFDRDESVSLVHRLAPGMDAAEADHIADKVGDLPLAVTQAAGVLAETGMTAAEYAAELDLHTDLVMAEGRPPSYPRPLAASVGISMSRLGAEDQAAHQLLKVCAFLAPEPIPLELFTSPDVSALLPASLREAARSAIALHSSIGRAGRFGLVKVTSSGPQLHRLTKAIIADQMSSPEQTEARHLVPQLLVAGKPADSRDPAHWPTWSRLMPHLLASDPAGSDNADLRAMAWSGCWYLLDRGDLVVGLSLAENLYRGWSGRLGPDHRDALHAAHCLYTAYQRVGLQDRAHALSRDTLDRRKRLYGANHRDTLASAVSTAWLMWESGQHQQAYTLNKRTLDRLRKVHGENRRLTLGAAHNLAIMLGGLGRVEQAISLDEQTYARRRALLGDEHPHTIISMLTLSEFLHRAGRSAEALTMCRDAMTRSARVLGPDHYTTADAGARLATLLHNAGRKKEALRLRNDALAWRERTLGKDHPHTQESARDLVESLLASRRIKDARRIETEFSLV